MRVKVVAPVSARKRFGLVGKLSSGKAVRLDLDNIRSELKRVRTNAAQKLGQLLEKVKGLNGFEGILFAATLEEAAGVILQMAGELRYVFLNNSQTARAVSERLKRKGFDVVHTYDCQYKPSMYEPAPSGRAIPSDVSWNSFGVEELRFETQGQFKPCIALLGVAALSSDGDIYLLQHFRNISDLLQEAEAVFFLAGLDKILETSEDCELQVWCMAIFGLEALLPGFQKRRENGLIPELLPREVEQRRYLILLDGGVRSLIGSPFAELFFCIGCRACNILCPSFIENGPLSPCSFLFSFRHTFSGEDTVSQEEIWACSGCQACKSMCPLGIDVSFPIMELRRELLRAGISVPRWLSEVRTHMKERGNPFGW